MLTINRLGIAQWSTWVNQVAKEAESLAIDRGCTDKETTAYVEGVRRGMREAVALLKLHEFVGPFDLDR
jgi:hypothetical protein